VEKSPTHIFPDCATSASSIAVALRQAGRSLSRAQ
jgi:hypothetical protein